MAAIRSINPKKANTCADYANSLLQFVTPCITVGNQLTPKGKDWESFLANGANKTELIHFLSVHYRSKNVYQSLKTSLMLANR